MHPAAQAVFTIDVEDWYHGIELPPDRWTGKEDRLSVGLDRVLELLASRRVRGTFFTLGWIAEKSPEAVKRISAAGHEIASHGYSHGKVYEIGPERFRDEVRRTKKLLEDLTGQAVTAHRSPFFSVTKESLWALPILKEEGYETDCSISPVRTWRYGIANSPEGPYQLKDIGLVEFPVSTFKLLTKKLGIGGAYLRIFPLRWIRRGIEGSLRNHDAAMFYAHPWEYDPEHPVSDEMEFKAKLTHYANLGSTYGKTAKLLDSHSFVPLREAVSALRASGRLPELPLSALQ